MQVLFGEVNKLRFLGVPNQRVRSSGTNRKRSMFESTRWTESHSTYWSTALRGSLIVCTFHYDGTVWLNVGDSYTSGNRRYRAPDRKNRARAMAVRPPTPEGLKPKDLIGVPWRLAFALQDAGWWVRSEVIWYKPNAHPESVRDRPTKAHETIFLLSKGKDYYYDHEIIRGPHERRLRTVWEIPTEPVKRVNGKEDDHPAMMPLSLARCCVAITSRDDSTVLDPYAGSGTTLLAARELGRRWVGVEIKSAFVDLIERRLRTS